ncbi:hypothetical protein K2O51_31225 (plasmid) [Cupriavidus pinatubonensis]|uniref:hypothetical protein n=1 Tax=Cupriavidus pinatubonensis TaxID=248026 RepID=UPI001C7382AC|nr:hypothetical protein [Cupriavidus pinatubonensis]QYY33716.1 hypothetical protein K2O51_31225 [Cupriavidus pinatubonensis]
MKFVKASEATKVGVAAALMAAASSASAVMVCSVDVAGKMQILDRIDASRDYVTDRIDTMRSDVVKAIGEQGKLLATQAAKAADQVSTTTRGTTSETERNRTQNRYPATQCGVTSTAKAGGGGGGSSAGTGVGEGTGGAPSAKNTYTPRQITAAEVARKEQLPPSDPNKQAADIGIGSCGTFAGGGSIGDQVRRFLCRGAGVSPSNRNRFIDADIRADTLFDGPQQLGAEKRRLTIDPVGDEGEALSAYLNNVGDPLPPRMVGAEELKTPTGQAYLGLKNIYEARMSLAKKPANDYGAWLLARSGNKAAAQQMTKDADTGAWVQKYLDTNFPAWTSKGVSDADLLNLEVEKRVGNEDWYKLMTAGGPEIQAREHLYVAALGQRIAFLALQEQKRTNVLLGQISAGLLQQNLRPVLQGYLNSLKSSAAANR